MRIMTVFGTRPEAIKMCPLILELKQRKNFECLICLTGQHKDMLSSIMDCFGLVEDFNLEIMKKNQTLTDITTAILIKLQSLLIENKPDIVLVHGDTTTSFAAALAAFYQKIPVGHVEAGLRTWRKYSPYPEEMNRCMISKIATYHFAPTIQNKNNLFEENIKNNVYVTGNTVIDALKTTVRKNYKFKEKCLNDINSEYKYILLTAHRRENIGKPLENICKSVLRIVRDKKIKVIYPVHPNPKVREIVYKYLDGNEQIILTEPIDVLDMHNLIEKCFLVMTDSGGLQEEAPALNKPVIVLRKETERQEAIDAGTAVLAGVEENNIYKVTSEILYDREKYKRMSNSVNPYGDGKAAIYIADVLENVQRNML